MTRGLVALALLMLLVLGGGAASVDAQEPAAGQAEASPEEVEELAAEPADGLPEEVGEPAALEGAAQEAAAGSEEPGGEASGAVEESGAQPPSPTETETEPTVPPGVAVPAEEPAPEPAAPLEAPSTPGSPAPSPAPREPTASPRASVPVAPAAESSVALGSDPAALPRFEDGPCSSPMASDYDAAGARCGTLVVAESRDRGAGRPRELRIAVAVLPPTGDAPAPDPVVFLHGGPGGSALRFGARWLTHPLRERRALILLDERGSGESRPLLCPELQLEDFRILAQNLRPAEEGAARVEVALACRDALVADGFDLGAWNSDAIADDVEDLRKALGYESWNVFGLSYGTKLALTLLRRHPEGIRSVVLDSVYPPNVAGWDARVASFDRALDALGQACAEQEACAEAFPDLRADLLAALARLDERPIIGSTGNEELLPSGRFVVNASDYAITVHQLLYDHRNLPIVPLYLREFRADPDTLAMPLADATTARAVGLARAVALAVGCYERAPFASPEGRARLGEAHSELLAHFVYFLPDYAICDEWSEAQAGPRESRAVESDVPALVLAGEIDPITPPAWAFTTVESLSNGRPFVFPGVGHGVDRSSACARGLVAAFLDDPAAELDATCIDETPPIAFVTDYHRSPGIYGLVQSLLVDRGHAAVLGFGGMLALLLSGAVGWLLVGAWRVASGGTSPPWHRAHVWIGSAAAVALLLWGAVFAAVVEVADAGGLLLLLGLPAWMGPVSLLRWVALGLAAVGLDALVRGRQDMTTARFLHGLAVGVAAALAAALPGLLGLA